MENTVHLGEAPASASGGAVSRGWFTLIFGCMFSGKTTKLLRRLNQIAPSARLAFKHRLDTRYKPDAIVTHDGESMAASPVEFPADILAAATPPITTVAIDEAHFFDDSLVTAVRSLTTRGIEVIMTALEHDCWGRPFPMTAALIERANDAILHTAICARCAGPANRTQRRSSIVNGQLVGGPESYEARCESCWTAPPIE